MDDRTRQHLDIAEQNLAFARTLLGESGSQTVELRWGIVVAFYAAMHFVNAYLWELARLEPLNHRDRREVIGRWTSLGPMYAAYSTLFDFSIRARYEPGFSARRSDLVSMLDRHLARVMATIERELPDDE